MEIDNHDSLSKEDPTTLLISSIAQELNDVPVLSPTCNIFKVPTRLRQVEEKAYTPQVVSIGPLHHGVEGLKAMEEHKKRYLKDFIERTKGELGFYFDLVRRNEGKLRAGYAEAIKFGGDEFVKIVLMDAVFIVEVLLRNKFPYLIDDSDRIFGAPWMLHDVRYDMLMLENQLPFFILNELYDIWKERVPFKDGWPSIMELSRCLFENRLILSGSNMLQQSDPSEVKHFVDFLRSLHLFSGEPPRDKLQTIKSPTMTELHNAGVKFQVGPCLQFKEGILQIPKLKVEDNTEVVLRNLVAFEQCYSVPAEIAHYLVVLDWLVDAKKDVELLVKHGILDNFRGDNKQVSSFINKLLYGVSIDTHNFCFASLCENLNTYCKTSWHRWKANLKQNYLHTQWAVISLVVGAIFLILTLIQTVFSGISA